MELSGKLYMELLFAGTICLLILFVNNIFLYKQKLTDRITQMLFFALIMVLSEIGWSYLDGNPDLGVATYLVIFFYCVSFVLFAALLDWYSIECFGVRFKRSHILLFYGIPVALFVLICVTTQWTGLAFHVDAEGYSHTGPLFNGLFYWLVLAYFFVPSIVGVYFLTIGKKRRPVDGNISVSLFVFTAMTPVLYFLEVGFVGVEAEAYSTMTLPVALALVYYVTNASVHTVLETKAHMEAVETDLRIASKIQADALPPVAPEFANHLDLNLRGSMNTAKEVGGDFYDYFAIDENRICFLIADVSGKGTPAALFMMTAKTMIKDYALTQDSTSEIFTEVNVRLCENNDQGMFATAWIGIVDTRTMTLQYTNAGHNYPFFQRPGQECEMVKEVHGLFLGGMEFTRYRQDEIQLQPGDRLLLYTDGVTEAHDKENNLYGEDRLQKVLERTMEYKGEKVLEEIFNDVNEHAQGVPQFDDITMIVLTIKDQEENK